MTQGTHPACVSPATSHARGDDAPRASMVSPESRGDHDCGGDAHRAPIASPEFRGDHNCGGGEAHPASIVSADVHSDIHALNISANLDAVAHVGDLLSAQVALDIGHDCFHV
jgi:hypothetical protein